MGWPTPSEGCNGRKGASGTQESRPPAPSLTHAWVPGPSPSGRQPTPQVWLPSPPEPAHLVPDQHRPHVEASARAARDPVLVHFHQPADALQQLNFVETLGGMKTSQGTLTTLAPAHAPLPHPPRAAGSPHRQAEADGRAQHPFHVEPRSEEAHALVPAFERLHAFKELQGEEGREARVQGDSSLSQGETEADTQGYRQKNTASKEEINPLSTEKRRERKDPTDQERRQQRTEARKSRTERPRARSMLCLNPFHVSGTISQE